jgi:hypothetical protein
MQAYLFGQGTHTGFCANLASFGAKPGYPVVLANGRLQG